MKKLNSTQIIFLIASLVYIYHLIVNLFFKSFFTPSTLEVWLWSYFPILTIFVFYKYYIKNYFVSFWKKILASIGIFLIVFFLLVLFIFTSHDIETLRNEAFQLEKLSSINEFQLEGIALAKLLNLKGMLLLFFLALGGVLMPLEEFLEKKSLISTNKKIFSLSILISFFILALIFLISPLFSIKDNYVEAKNLRSFFDWISCLFFVYSSVFLGILIFISCISKFRKANFFSLFKKTQLK